MRSSKRGGDGLVPAYCHRHGVVRGRAVPAPYAFGSWIADAEVIRYITTMLAPTKHRFNVKEYYRMAETGVLRPDARVELLNGEIIDMSPIGPFHGGVTNYLIEIFTAASKGRWMTSAQNPGGSKG